MAIQPRSILRSTTQSTNTTKRVTWADELFTISRSRRRPPPSIIPPSSRVVTHSVRRTSRTRRDTHVCRKHDKETRRRRRAHGVVKKRTAVEVRRVDVKKKKKKNTSDTTTKKKKKCKRGLFYARQYVVNKCQLKDDILDIVDARTMYKIYVDIRRKLGKKVDQGLKRRMVEDDNRIIVDKRTVKRKRKELDNFVNKMLPGVRAEAYSRSQLSRVAFAAVVNKFDRVERERRNALR